MAEDITNKSTLENFSYDTFKAFVFRVEQHLQENHLLNSAENLLDRILLTKNLLREIHDLIPAAENQKSTSVSPTKNTLSTDAVVEVLRDYALVLNDILKHLEHFEQPKLRPHNR